VRVSAKTACPACGSDCALLFRARDENRRLSDAVFDYHRCTRCGLIFLSPVPANLTSYYTGEYYGTPPRLEDLSRAAAAVEGYKLDLVQRFVGGGRLLDIGPGLGGFACLAKEAGYEVDVIEMDRDCCTFLSDVVGVRAICSGAPESALEGEGPYDVVTLWHAIEHLPDPFGMLAAASRNLKPGGVVVVAAPNPDSLQFRLLGRWWTHVDAPRHLFLVPLSVLVASARDNGLQVAWRTTTDKGGLGWNAFGWRQSLANLASKRMLRPFAKAAGAGLTYLAAPLERTGERSATYTVVLTKEAST
jgi:SAM-dependent methyltransferase